MTMKEEQDAREAQIKAWAESLKPTLSEIFGETADVYSYIEDGNLVLEIRVPKPLPGRRNAKGLLQIKVTRIALEDYLLQEAERATPHFLGIVRDRQRRYVPKPREESSADPEPEVWWIQGEDFRVR